MASASGMGLLCGFESSKLRLLETRTRQSGPPVASDIRFDGDGDGFGQTKPIPRAPIRPV